MSPATRWVVLAVLSLARVAIAFQFQSTAALAPDLVAGLHMQARHVPPGAAVAAPRADR